MPDFCYTALMTNSAAASHEVLGRLELAWIQGEEECDLLASKYTDELRQVRARGAAPVGRDYVPALYDAVESVICAAGELELKQKQHSVRRLHCAVIMMRNHVAAQYAGRVVEYNTHNY